MEEPRTECEIGDHSSDVVASLEDACPENRDIAGVLRELGGVCRGDATIHWADGDQRWQEGLQRLERLRASGHELHQFFSDLHAAHVGHEHEIFVVPNEPERVFKVTLNGAYGCRLRFCPKDPDLEERFFQPEVSLDPRSYLLRWMLLNAVTDFRTRLEAIMPPTSNVRELRVCVSQPILPRGNPSDGQIAESLAEVGFGRIGRDSYINFGARIVLGDLGPRNARLVDGVFVPFDAIAEFVDPTVLNWAFREMHLFEE